MDDLDFTDAWELKLIRKDKKGGADETKSPGRAIEKALMSSRSVLDFERAGFDGRKAMITFSRASDSDAADNSCSIVKASNQFIVAQAILNRGKAGRKIDWRILAKRLGSSATKQKVKDAVIGINLNIQKSVKVNDDLLVWNEGFVVRRI